MRTLSYYLALVLLLGGVASCQRETDPAPEEDVDLYTLSLSRVQPESKGLIGSWNDRSAETILSQARLAIYLNGRLHTDYPVGSGDKVQLNKALEYNIYALTSTGEGWVWPQDEADLAEKTLILEEDSSVYRTRGIPLFGSLTKKRPEEADAYDGLTDGCITLPVRRLFARVSFHFEPDFASLQPYAFNELVSLNVCHSNNVLRPFSDSCKALSTSDIRISGWDRKTEPYLYSDQPDAIVLYIPENLQGDLLSHNDDPYRKIPDQVDLLNGSGKADLCTYLEAVVHAEETYLPGVGGDATYRFYLGKNTTTNFDVEGNVDYDVTLTLSREGLGMTANWKVDTGSLSDNRHFHFLANSRMVRPGGTAYLRCTYGSSDTYDNFAAPMWGSQWGFYAGDAATYTAYTTTGATDASQVHLHGTSLVCPHCGHEYEAFPDGLDGDLSRLGSSFIQTRQHQWIAENLYREGNEFICRYCSDNPTVFFPAEDPDHLPLVDCSTYAYTGSTTASYLWISIPDSVPLHSVFPVFGGSGDGRHTDRIDIQVGDDTPVLLNLSALPRYIAQQGSVTASRLPAGTTGLTFRTTYQSTAGMLSLEDNSPAATNVSCTIKSCRAGTATVKVYDKATDLEVGSFAMQVAAPVIAFEGNSSTTQWLVPDGTALDLPAHYETAEGAAMDVAATDQLGFGNHFAPSLYAAWLGDITAQAGTHADTPLLGFSGRQAYLRYFVREGHAATFNSPLADAVRLGSAHSTEVSPVSLTAAIHAPVSGYLGDDILIEDWSLLEEIGWDATQTAAIAWRARSGSTLLLPGGHPSIGNYDVQTPVTQENTSVSFANEGIVDGMINGTPPYYDNIQREVSASGQVTVRVAPGGTSKGIGQFAIVFNVKNFRSNQYHQTKIGTMKIYLHTVIGGWIGTWQSSTGGFGPGYTCTIYVYPLGYYKVPSAFNNMLEDCMTLDPAIQAQINAPAGTMTVKGVSMDIAYIYPGLVTWSPDNGVYEMDLTPRSHSNANGNDCKRACYDNQMPSVVVDEEKRMKDAYKDILKASGTHSGSWHYAIGGMQDADNGNRGYYVFDFFQDIYPASRGWYDYHSFTTTPPCGQ
ncbi:MAG: DUF4906 domain-containing protein [Bacteroidales bacterium]|nr:DUF4906 domain-containing protein [Bacteroidales bacterium]